MMTPQELYAFLLRELQFEDRWTHPAYAATFPSFFIDMLAAKQDVYFGRSLIGERTIMKRDQGNRLYVCDCYPERCTENDVLAAKVNAVLETVNL